MRALSFGKILRDIIEGEAHTGGASFNLAAHLAGMGAESSLISSVGRGKLEADTLKAAKDKVVETSSVKVQPILPTGAASAAISEEDRQKILY